MKSLTSISPSAEQLTIIKRVRAGVELIRGAAGSGKTTTAVLKLKLLALWVLSRRKRDESEEPVRVLVLTFNKTLRGYVEELISNNTPSGKVEITIDTFGHWANSSLGGLSVYNGKHLADLCVLRSTEIGLPGDFLRDEVEYVLGRFPEKDLATYVDCARDGRGATPRVEKDIRTKILDLVVYPYIKWKRDFKCLDWHDVTNAMIETKFHTYDVVIVDETQDFTANSLRAILNQTGDDTAVCFILDTAQRIYVRGFTWAEIGLKIRPESSHRLSVNYRNTPEVARLAASLINCVKLDDDGTPPLLAELEDNPRPIMLRGLFNKQVEWAIQYIKDHVDLAKESVAFLHPKGWFTYLEGQLDTAGIEYVVLTRNSEWPKSEVNVALCTLHSAKGLDFDHCFIIGLASTSLPDGQFAQGDDRFDTACRLLSMAIARARCNVILGYKPGEEPAILANLDKTTYDVINLN